MHRSPVDNLDILHKVHKCLFTLHLVDIFLLIYNVHLQEHGQYWTLSLASQTGHYSFPLLSVLDQRRGLWNAPLNFFGLKMEKTSSNMLMLQEFCVRNQFHHPVLHPQHPLQVWVNMWHHTAPFTPYLVFWEVLQWLELLSLLSRSTVVLLT